MSIVQYFWSIWLKLTFPGVEQVNDPRRNSLEFTKVKCLNLDIYFVSEKSIFLVILEYDVG